MLSLNKSSGLLEAVDRWTDNKKTKRRKGEKTNNCRQSTTQMIEQHEPEVEEMIY